MTPVSANAQASDGTIQLKRYAIAPGRWESFLDIWRRIVVVRERHGFDLLFAFEDREADMFTWAIVHHGDFDAAAAEYYADPDREALDTVRDFVTSFEIRTVTRTA